MCATISTSPVSASAATAVTRPSGPKRGASTRPSSSSCLDAATGKGSVGIDKSLERRRPASSAGRFSFHRAGGSSSLGARPRDAYPLQDAENSSWNAPSWLLSVSSSLSSSCRLCASSWILAWSGFGWRCRSPNVVAERPDATLLVADVLLDLLDRLCEELADAAQSRLDVHDAPPWVEDAILPASLAVRQAPRPKVR